MEDSSADPTQDQEPGDSTGGGSRSRPARWVLLDGDRLLVTFGLFGVVAVTLLVVATAGPESLRQALYTDDTIDWLFQSLLGAIVTGVTLVVTINQLVLAQELGAVGDQRQRMEEAMTFREDAEEYLDEAVSPARPAQFFGSLLSAIRQRCGELSSLASDRVDQSAREELTGFTDDLSRECSRAEDATETADFGGFELMRPLLRFEYSIWLNESRRLRTVHEGALGPKARNHLKAIQESLELFGMAREHVKTLYFQWELIELSRRMLYAAVPSLLVAVTTLLFVENPGQIRGTTLGVSHGLVFVSVATAVALVPFLLLVAYVLRVATVTKRTLAIGPFLLGGTERD